MTVHQISNSMILMLRACLKAYLGQASLLEHPAEGLPSARIGGIQGSPQDATNGAPCCHLDVVLEVHEPIVAAKALVHRLKTSCWRHLLRGTEGPSTFSLGNMLC